ncbi:hypothetical protein [Vibrio alfacsensis]|uniref:hypothetical protein n=1 Tax=Vibrio alfacsensis TaxID=1074311 RepID=UPI0040684391
MIFEEPSEIEHLTNNELLTTKLGFGIIGYEQAIYQKMRSTYPYNGGNYKWVRDGEYVYLVNWDCETVLECTEKGNGHTVFLAQSWASIWANLFWCSHLSFQMYDTNRELSEYFSGAYHNLRDRLIALEETPNFQREISKILKLLD